MMFLASAEQSKQQLQSILNASIIDYNSLSFKEYIRYDQYVINLNLDTLLKAHLSATTITLTTELVYLAARSIQYEILSLPVN